MPTRHERPRAAALGGVLLVLAPVLASCARPVEVSPPSPVAEARATCDRLLATLPDQVDGLDRRTVSPTDALAAAWGDPAVVLRCGVPEPAALTPDAQVYEVDHVAWFPEPLTAGYLFTTYGRTVNVEVTVPDDYSPEADVLVDLAAAVKATVPAAGVGDSSAAPPTAAPGS